MIIAVFGLGFMLARDIVADRRARRAAVKEAAEWLAAYEADRAARIQEELERDIQAVMSGMVRQ
jgi:hypothetical protein